MWLDILNIFVLNIFEIGFVIVNVEEVIKRVRE